MNKTTHAYIVIIIGLIFCYLTFDFINDAKEDFIQLNYDWSSIEVLDELNDVTIDSVSHEFLALRKDFIVPKNLNNKSTFSLEDGKKSYFRTSEIIINEDKIVFSGVKWINQIPNRNLRTSNLEIIQLPLIQPSGKTITTIGDSQLIWREARAIRRELSISKKLLFVGHETDVYGYPFEGGTFDTTSELLRKTPRMEPVNYYVLFFGAQDKALSKEQLKQNICELLAQLGNKKKTEQIFAITLPPSTNKEFEDYNTFFNKCLLDCVKGQSKVTVLDLYKQLETESDYLLDDEVHLNKRGNQILTKLLRKQF